jgi:phospholipid-binding lipoprotein MlaA
MKTHSVAMAEPNLDANSTFALGGVRRIVAVIGMALLSTGCATSGNPKDPIEGFNRAMFAINDGVDQAVLRPVAVGYDTVLPSPVKQGVTNFFGNIGDVFTAVNNILQGKVADGVSDFGRVLLNSTVGLFGLIDVASDVGMEKHDEDFGQTFGRWGAGSGAYVVLPLMGPSSVRDVLGSVVDSNTSLIPQVNDVSVRNSLMALNLIDKRAGFLAADKVVEAAALDKYSYVRDAYLQRRNNLVHDGNPPREREDASIWTEEDVRRAAIVLKEMQLEPAKSEPISDATALGEMATLAAK